MGLESRLQGSRVKHIGMDGIFGSASDVIVDAAGEDFRANPAMHQPFLTPHGVQGVDGSAPHQVQSGLVPESDGSPLRS